MSIKTKNQWRDRRSLFSFVSGRWSLDIDSSAGQGAVWESRLLDSKPGIPGTSSSVKIIVFLVKICSNLKEYTKKKKKNSTLTKTTVYFMNLDDIANDSGCYWSVNVPVDQIVRKRTMTFFKKKWL